MKIFLVCIIFVLLIMIAGLLYDIRTIYDVGYKWGYTHAELEYRQYEIEFNKVWHNYRDGIDKRRLGEC